MTDVRQGPTKGSSDASRSPNTPERVGHCFSTTTVSIKYEAIASRDTPPTKHGRLELSTASQLPCATGMKF